jgi:hypothetical protein
VTGSGRTGPGGDVHGRLAAEAAEASAVHHADLGNGGTSYVAILEGRIRAGVSI